VYTGTEPLDNFNCDNGLDDSEMGGDGDKKGLELEIGEDALDGSMPKGKAIRSATYTKLEDLHLVKACHPMRWPTMIKPARNIGKESNTSFIVRCQPPLHDH
jgi:hypothetical protein